MERRLKIIRVQDREGVYQMLPLFLRHFHSLKIKGWDPLRFAEKACKIIESGTGFILGIEENGQFHGGIIAVVYESINLERTMCSEVFFRVFEEGLLEARNIVKEFEKIGKEFGAEGFQLCLTSFYEGDIKKAENFYRKLGYFEEQKVYCKLLWELRQP